MTISLRYICEEDMPVVMAMTQQQLDMIAQVLEAVGAAEDFEVSNVSRYRIRDMAKELRNVHKDACESAARRFDYMAGTDK